MKINFKLIKRNLLHSGSTIVINIIGITIAYICSFSIIVWIQNELSFDETIPFPERTYRLTFETTNSGNTLHFARCYQEWISQIPAAFPQIEDLVRLEPLRHTAIKSGVNKFYTDRVFSTDSNFFKVFGIGLIKGDPEDVLKEPHSAVISSSIAKKCFGGANPVGQIILMSGEYDTIMQPFTITGITNDSPALSHIHFDILTSFVRPQDAPGWAYVYLLLKKETNPDAILGGFPAFINDLYKSEVQKSIKPYLQKVTDIHLFSNKDREVEPTGNMTNILVFLAISIILLLVSWVNYFNLNKARLFKLQKQINIQSITGSNKWMIISQALAESIFIVLLAFFISVNILDLSGDITYSFLGWRLLPNGLSDLIKTGPEIVVIIFFTVFIGSAPLTHHVLRDQLTLGTIRKSFSSVKKGVSSYGILMTAQIFLSIVLLISAITISQQKKYILSNSLGKMSSDILVFKKQNWVIRSKYNAFRTAALENPLVKSISATMDEPSGETMDALQIESSALDENHKNISLFVISVEDNFLDFFGIKLISGRSFSPFNPKRKGEDYILNETAVKKLGWTNEEAIGRQFKIKFDTPDIFYGGTVVGVVHDFNYTNIKQEIKPYVLFQKPIFYLTFLIKVDSARREEAISYLKNIWDVQMPDYPFQYESISDLYKTAYQKEISQSKFTGLFSLLAIVIICLGLFAVTSVLVAKRTKEIGIRKVNGASAIEILKMLNSDFIKWTVVAFVIACPAAWYIMEKWLQSFVYKTEPKLWVFILSGGIILIIVLFTVTLQSWRAATRNPSEALSYE